MDVEDLFHCHIFIFFFKKVSDHPFIHFRNPTLAAKHKTLADSMKERPRFNRIVNRGTALGGFKSQTY